jgi:concentrative nucleoside transporter, CNT family
MLTGLLGIVLILSLAWLLSHHRWRVDWLLVIRGLALQVFLAVLLLQVPQSQWLFANIGKGIETLLGFADQGAGFVFGAIVAKPMVMEQLFGAGAGFIFAVKLLSSIIFVSALIGMAYHVGLVQAVVRALAWGVTRLLGASGAEALNNTASVFVGQVESQLLIKPYLATMTTSELLTVMSGSMACIAGGVLAIYVAMGIPASYLLTASIMAIPGALVISKLIIPETGEPLTAGDVRMTLEKKTVNLIDAAATGASEGWHVGMSVCVMLIAFISLIAMLDAGLGGLGKQLVAWGVPSVVGGISVANLSMQGLMGWVFQFVAMALGVPAGEATTAGSLMGTKLVLNEFVAYTQLIPLIKSGALAPRTVAIITFALCGFANIASIAIQVGGIGAMVPSRKQDLARLGPWALLCGTLASYLSAAWAGVFIGVQPWMNANAPWMPYVIMAGAALVLLAGSLVSMALKWGQAQRDRASMASSPTLSSSGSTQPSVTLPLQQQYSTPSVRTSLEVRPPGALFTTPPPAPQLTPRPLAPNANTPRS